MQVIQEVIENKTNDQTFKLIFPNFIRFIILLRMYKGKFFKFMRVIAHNLTFTIRSNEASFKINVLNEQVKISSFFTLIASVKSHAILPMATTNAQSYLPIFQPATSSKIFFVDAFIESLKQFSKDFKKIKFLFQTNLYDTDRKEMLSKISTFWLLVVWQIKNLKRDFSCGIKLY